MKASRVSVSIFLYFYFFLLLLFKNRNFFFIEQSSFTEWSPVLSCVTQVINLYGNKTQSSKEAVSVI